MLEEFLKDKKKTGIFVVLVIVIIVAGVLYCSSGFKELKKNDTETIFIDDNSSDISSTESEEINSGEGNKEESSSNNKSVTKEKNITVEIKGEVRKPDVYVLKENSIVKDLIEEAGGLTENADITNINRAKQLQNHELVYIGNKNDTSESPMQTASAPQNSNIASAESMVNINSATSEELKTLNGIGDSKAKSIIEYRDKNGGFQNIEDIKNVDGIGEKMFEKIKDSITI
ncbi:MAG: ComEA family DNA-binding protein [Clostridium sp.]|nr:ComEA family DNA-binding protein [Clostridium sp.]